MRIFIAEANRDVCVCLQMFLNREPGMQVIGIATRPDDMVGQAGAAQPDVVLLDWKLVTAAPADIIKNLHSMATKPKINVMHIHPESKEAAQKAGADEFISKDQPSDQLRLILKKLMQNKTD